MKMERSLSGVHRDGPKHTSPGAIGVSPLDMLENVLDHGRLFLIVFFACVLAALAYAIAATPMYAADALIRIEENKPSALGSLSAISKALDIQNSAVTGEIDIVRSRSVLTEAIDATGAQAEVSVKNRLPVIGSLIGSLMPKDANGLAAAPFGLSSWAWGGERVEFGAFDAPPAQAGKSLELDSLGGNRFRLKDSNGNDVLSGVVGVPSSANGYRVHVSRMVARPGETFRIRYVALEPRIEAILKKLSVTETKRQSGVMQLNFEDPDPVFAARMLNAIAVSYLNFNAKRRAEDAERSLAFLNTQLPAVKARLQQAEQALNAFRNEAGSIDAQGDINLLVDQLAFVDKSRLEAKLEYQDLLAKYVPGQPQVVAAANKLKELDQQAAMLKEKAARLPSQQQTYLRLARDVEVNNQLYVGLLNNTQQLQIAEAGTVGNASIVDKAAVIDKPVRPKRMLVVLAGGVIGAMLAFAVVQGVALLSGRIRDLDQLAEAAGIPVLGVLPAASHAGAADTGPVSATADANGPADAPLADALEALALALQYRLRADRSASKIIVVTSAVPGQGKSMIVANLAWLFSRKGLRTAIVDANVSAPALHRYLPVSTANGLFDVLAGTLQPENAMVRVADNFHVLPAGNAGAAARKRLDASAFDRLVASLRDRYDMIVVDAPSALPVADVAALSKFSDLTLLVARQGAVSSAELTDAVDGLRLVGARVDGFVLNGFAPSPMHRVRRAGAQLRERHA
ncbi:GNVR domain-containing protein [Burkholderia latens]|uniref:GNVR domain-containing protein n=1 Tax=Burkholderia latens TaxID=488446 RepID=UPI001FC832A6|nr:GNVR domain-containing protein [Burkholderia latens]